MTATHRLADLFTGRDPADQTYRFLADDPGAGPPHVALAALVVTYLAADGSDLARLGSAVADRLRSRRVVVPRLDLHLLLSTVVMAAVVALDSPGVDDWVRWYGQAFGRGFRYPSTTLLAVANVLDDITYHSPTQPPPPPQPGPAHPSPPPPCPPAEPEPPVTPGQPVDPADLLAAVRGTAWETPERFAELLANPGLQARVLLRIRMGWSATAR